MEPSYSVAIMFSLETEYVVKQCQFHNLGCESGASPLSGLAPGGLGGSVVKFFF